MLIRSDKLFVIHEKIVKVLPDSRVRTLELDGYHLVNERKDCTDNIDELQNQAIDLDG